jgi:DNA-binding Lrp family transcriptional regulator
MRAYVLVNVRTGEERQIKKLLTNTPGISRVEVTFGPYDMIVQVEAPDLTALGKLVSGTIRSAPGVENTLTCLAVE